MNLPTFGAAAIVSFATFLPQTSGASYEVRLHAVGTCYGIPSISTAGTYFMPAGGQVPHQEHEGLLATATVLH